MYTLLTGGLGYIGSHIAIKLKERAIIIDNCSNSKLNYKKILPNAKVFIKDVNYISLDKIFQKFKIDKVIHLAGYKSVNESFFNPLKYYENNIQSTIDLLRIIEKYKVKKLVFSSSATVYGNNNISPLKENMQLNSTSPYGTTKIIIEKMIDEFIRSNNNFKAISLRYFNPIGSSRKYKLSDQPLGTPQNIMPILIETLKNKKNFFIYGKNYKTLDGTCVRDYIHVEDLADAHILAIKKIDNIHGHEKINIGSGRGYSVLKLINTFEKVNNIKINFKFSKKRSGDVEISYASISKAKKILNWHPKYDLKRMCEDSWIAAQ